MMYNCVQGDFSLQFNVLCLTPGVFGVVYDGYLSNAEDEPEGTTPVIIKTVKGRRDKGREQLGGLDCRWEGGGLGCWDSLRLMYSRFLNLEISWEGVWTMRLGLLNL